MRQLVFELQRFATKEVKYLTEGDDEYTLQGFETFDDKVYPTVHALGGDDTVQIGEIYVDNVVVVYGEAGDDSLVNRDIPLSLLEGNEGNDILENHNQSSVTLDGGAGDDVIKSYGDMGAKECSINGGAGADNIYNQLYYSTIDGGDDNDTITVDSKENSINGGAGDDEITLEDDDAGNHTVKGGKGNDNIRLNFTSTFGTVYEYESGDGNDVIIGSNAPDTLKISSADTGGNVIVKAGSKIMGGSWSPTVAGNDLVFNVGSNTITFKGAADTGINVESSGITAGFINSKNGIALKYTNNSAGAVITGLEGDDYISNPASTFGEYDNVRIYSGTGDDTIDSGVASNVFLDSGTGNDSIKNGASYSTIDAGDGNNYIENDDGSATSITSGSGKDTISNKAPAVTIASGAGNDSIHNGGNKYRDINGGDEGAHTEYVSINAGAGDDVITNIFRERIADVYDHRIESDTNYATLEGGDGKDTVDNFGSIVTINGGNGNDVIHNYGLISRAGAAYSTVPVGTDAKGNKSLLNGGDGNDSIFNENLRVIIWGGSGDDTISLTSDAHNNIINYSSGDGNDSIAGFDSDDVLSISGGSYSSTKSGQDIIVTVGTGKITLVGAANLERVIIDGKLSSGSSSTSTTTGGNSSSTTRGGSSSTSTTTGGGSSSTTRGGSSSTSTTTGGGSSSTTRGGSSSTSTTTGGGSSSTTRGGSSSSSTTTGGSSSSTTRGGSSSASTTTGGGSSSTTRGGSSSTSTTTTGGGSSSTTRGGSSSSSTTTGGGSTSTTRGGSSSSSTTTGGGSSSTTRGGSSSSSVTASQNVYTGGDKIVSNYAGEKIVFGEMYTGATFDDNGNFFVGSPTGTLAIQNATDKIVDLRDASDNAFIKAYSASNAGVIDGRGLAGYEIINGASNGSNVIFAGDGGSQLWGGSGFDADALVGGNGSDIFVGGRLQGADNIFNASSADVVNLVDASLSDIVAAVGSDNGIAIGFNTGNIISIQSTELLSAAVNLADGSSWRFNHVTKGWQSA